MTDLNELCDISYRKSPGHNFLCLTPRASLTQDYQTEMLTENSIPHLLPVQLRSVNGKDVFCYAIDSMQPLSRCYEHKEISLAEGQSLMNGILDAFDSVRDFLLDEDCLVLDADHICIDPESLKPMLLFCPFYKKPFNDSLLGFAEYLIEHVSAEDKNAAVWAYGLYKKIRSGSFTLSELRSEKGSVRASVPESRDNMPLPETMASENLRPDPREKEPQREGSSSLSDTELDALFRDIPEDAEEKAAFRPDKQFLLPGVMAIAGILLLAGVLPVGSASRPVGIALFAAGIAGAVFMYLRGKKKKADDETDEDSPFPTDTEEDPADFSLDEAFEDPDPGEGFGKTVFIGGSDLPADNVLVEKGKNRSIVIKKFPFTIGKVKGRVDLALSDPSVSRIHARILMDEGRAYLQDCHSTNGTYLNGVPLEAEEKVLLEKDDEIGIGKLRFSYT